MQAVGGGTVEYSSGHRATGCSRECRACRTVGNRARAKHGYSKAAAPPSRTARRSRSARKSTTDCAWLVVFTVTATPAPGLGEYARYWPTSMPLRHEHLASAHLTNEIGAIDCPVCSDADAPHASHVLIVALPACGSLGIRHVCIVCPDSTDCCRGNRFL